MQGNTNLYPTFPGVWVQQQNLVAYIRLAADPNTTSSQMYVNGPVYRNSVYTLENTVGAPAFDYNHAFTLTVDNNTVARAGADSISPPTPRATIRPPRKACRSAAI